jgi:hypothetical protein
MVGTRRTVTMVPRKAQRMGLVKALKKELKSVHSMIVTRAAAMLLRKIQKMDFVKAPKRNKRRLAWLGK